MRSTKQQGILLFFNRDYFQLSEKNNFQSGHEASTSVSNLQQTVKSVCADIFTLVGGTKNRKRELSGNMIKIVATWLYCSFM